MSDTTLIYIGNKFYLESGTMMSSIYQESTHARYDWGFVERDLREGKEVTIRPATDAEFERFQKQLDELKNKKATP